MKVLLLTNMLLLLLAASLPLITHADPTDESEVEETVSPAAPPASSETDDNNDDDSKKPFAEQKLQEFLTAAGNNDRLTLSKLTKSLVKYGQSVQHRVKFMLSVKSSLAKLLRKISEMQRFADLRSSMLSLASKLLTDSRLQDDIKTPAQLQDMIDWVEKRKVNGKSVDENLDDAVVKWRDASESLARIQSAISESLAGVKQATAGEQADQEKVKASVQLLTMVMESEKTRFLALLDAGLKQADLVVSLLKVQPAAQ